MAGWNDELETGLRDDFDATIVESYFGTDPRFEQGALTLLKWQLHGIDSDGIAFEDTVLVTIGKGWVTLDGGATVRHESGNERKNFGASSHIGLIMSRCQKDFNMGELLQSRSDGPQDAKAWKGLRFHFKREVKSYAGSGGLQDSNKLMPTAFLGVDEVLGAAAPVQQAAVASPAAVAQTAAPAANGAADTATIVARAQLTQLAKAATSFEGFMSDALQIDGVLANQELLNEVTDPARFFAAARA